MSSRTNVKKAATPIGIAALYQWLHCFITDGLYPFSREPKLFFWFTIELTIYRKWDMMRNKLLHGTFPFHGIQKWSFTFNLSFRGKIYNCIGLTLSEWVNKQHSVDTPNLFCWHTHFLYNAHAGEYFLQSRRAVSLKQHALNVTRTTCDKRRVGEEWKTFRSGSCVSVLTLRQVCRFFLVHGLHLFLFCCL